MKRTANFLAAIGAAAALSAAAQAQPQVLVTDFNTFFENELYASWLTAPAGAPDTIIVSGPDSYSVTATGYGSNYTYIGDKAIMGAGSTHVQLDITLSGPAAADGKLGPIIDLVDGDGTWYTFAWYGQKLGDHLLTMPITVPTGISVPGTTPGLDLNTLTHMHMELDPSGFGTTGAYTAEFKNLNLVTAGAGDFDANGVVDGYDLLVWQRSWKFLPYADFKAHFGEHYDGVAAGQGVPEPATASLVLLGGMGLMLRKRRSSGVR